MKLFLLHHARRSKNKLESLYYRDKTRVQMSAKNVSSFEIIMFAVYGPHSWFWHKAKKQFFDQIWCFFFNKSNILTILFIVKYEKITLFDEFLVLMGPIISRFFACSNEEKINKNNKGCLLMSYLYGLHPASTFQSFCG